MGGDETAFFAVEAYDGVDCDALELLEAWLGIWDCWETEVIGWTVSKMTSCGFVGGGFVVCGDVSRRTEGGRYPFQKGDRISNLICSIRRAMRRLGGEWSGCPGGKRRS
jgi:hypothetical protein